MKVPGIGECESMLAEYPMPENIMGHTATVRRVANYLAKKISKKKKIDLDAVDKAALMHDFLKWHCIENKCRHAQEAAKVLEGKGYKEFGEIIRLHGLEEVTGFNGKTPIETKVVWYADKRVTHDKVSTLEERYAYIEQHYGSQSEKKMREIKSTIERASKLEEELLGLAGLEKDYLFGDA